MYLSITTHLVYGLERFHYIEKRQALFSASKNGASHGASQKDIYGPCVVMVVAQKVGGAHKHILYLTTELSYLVKQNIKTLHTEKERYTQDLLPTQLTSRLTCVIGSEQHCLSLASIAEAQLGRLELP